MRLSGIIGGVALVALTFFNVVATLVVPRAIPSRLVSILGGGIGGMLRVLARPLRSYDAKDRIFALHGAMWLLGVLALWLMLLGLGFGLVDWGVSGISFRSALRESGSSLFTLGFASIPNPAATVVDLVAAASGLVVIALQIAYLPVIYAAFSRRETMVTTLSSRAGDPAWGPEILWRHQQVGIAASLPKFYSDWEFWCADVAETHSIYPVVIYLRSPHPLRSWVTGLIAVLDSAAMYLAVAPQHAPTEARLCLRMGFTSLREIADALRIRYDPDPLPDTPVALTFAEFDLGYELVRASGFPMERASPEAWEHFRGWRVNYESVAYEVAERVVAPPGPWTGPRRALPGHVIMPGRPLDRTPDQPFGTDETVGMQ